MNDAPRCDNCDKDPAAVRCGDATGHDGCDLRICLSCVRWIRRTVERNKSLTAESGARP